MKAAPAAKAEFDFAFEKLTMGRLTWLGLVIAVIGWALLLGATAAVDLVTDKGPRLSPTFHADLVEIAKCIIASGFGLAVVGALQTGFGTLSRFFGAVLTRSSQRENAPVRPIEPAPVRPPRSPTPPPPPLERRPYRMLPDGTVEVETILGTRLFKTMAEAREFI